MKLDGKAKQISSTLLMGEVVYGLVMCKVRFGLGDCLTTLGWWERPFTPGVTQGARLPSADSCGPSDPAVGGRDLVPAQYATH